MATPGGTLLYQGRSSLTLQTLWRHITNHDISIVIRLNLDSLRCQGKHGCLDRSHIVTPRNPFPPYHPVTWLQNCILRGSLQHSCHLPPTGYTRPPQDQTPAVDFPRKIRHGSHVATVRTPHVVQDALLEVRGDSVPEDLGCWGE